MDVETERMLRRLALSGRMEEVRATLLDILDEDSNDDDAKAELQRLINGQPLRLTLSAEERHKQAKAEAWQALERAMEKLPLQHLKLYSRGQLEDIKEKFDSFKSTYRVTDQDLPENTRAYLQELSTRLKQFRGKNSRKVILATLGVVAGAAMLIGIGSAFRQAALNKQVTLRSALKENQYEPVLAALRDADSGITRFFCPSIGSDVTQAENWLKSIETQYRKLDAQISLFEQGKKKIADLSPEEQLAIETAINHQLRGQEILQERWRKQCAKEYDELQTRKNKVLQDIATPLDSPPELTGDTKADLARITDYESYVRSRLKHTAASQELFQFSTDYASPMAAQLAQIVLLKNEVKQNRYIFDKLPKCRTYPEYQKQVQKIASQYYQPTEKYVQAYSLMPTINEMACAMAAPEGEFAEAQLKAANDILVEGKCSFPAAFPATEEMVNLTKDLFSAPSYQYRVYALELEKGTTWYSTIQPTIDKTNFVHYKRSSIDPEFTPEENYMEFQNDGTRTMYAIDATGLMSSLKLDASDFYVHTNLPKLLTATLNLKPGNHPALAQAYIYYCLLQLTDACPYPLLKGVRFSPTLKEHTDSFMNILKRHKIQLVPGCWLSTAPHIQKAEKDFAAWFNTHRGCDYAAEMRNHFIAGFSVKPHFCGYINEYSQLSVFVSMKESERLWYVSTDGIKYTTNKIFDDAIPLSPVFVEKRAMK